MIDNINIQVQMWNETVSLFGERILRMWRMSGMPKKETSFRKETGQKKNINMELQLGIKGTFSSMMAYMLRN